MTLMSATLQQIEQEILALFQAAEDYNALNLSTAASISWLVYDIILTFPREMELFWRTRFTFHKVLYIITRYCGLAFIIVLFIGNSRHAPSVDFCKRWLWFIGIGPAVANASGELLFMTRIYAVYGQSRRVLFALLGLWLAEVSIVWTFTFLNVSATHITHPPPGYPLPGCVSNSTPAKFVHLDIAAWVAGSFVSLCFFILVVVKFLQNLEYDFSWRSIKTMNVFELQRLAPVLVMFMRDGILYFLLILTCNIVELFMTCVLANRPSSECAMGWFIASYGVASSRLYLNLRESVAQKEETLDYELDDYALEFRVPTQASMDAMTHLGE